MAFISGDKSKHMIYKEVQNIMLAGKILHNYQLFHEHTLGIYFTVREGWLYGALGLGLHVDGWPYVMKDSQGGM